MNFFRRTYNHFGNYSRNSTIHALNYIGNQNIHWSARIFWIFCFLSSISAYLYFGKETWTRWHEVPIVVVQDSKLTHISEIPFPAVTVCLGLKTKIKEGFITTAGGKKEWWTDKVHAKNLYEFCNTNRRRDSYEYPPINRYVSRDEVLWKLKELSCDYKAMIYKNEIDAVGFPDFLLPTIIRKFGLCHTWNMVKNNELFSENVNPFFMNLKPEILDFRNEKIDVSFGVGTGYSLEFDQKFSSKPYNCCLLDKQIAVYVHSPYEYPGSPKQLFYTSVKSITRVSVEPQGMVTPPELRKYDVRTRNCYFQGEKQLKFFKHYTYWNCMMECDHEHIFKKCDCPYSEKHKMNMCNLTLERACGIKRNNLSILFDNTYSSEECTQGCLPNCNEINYKLNFNQLASYDSEASGELNIFYATDRFLQTKNVEVFGITEFLSSCGGLLGLLMGGSVLSLVEILYHFCIKRHVEKDRVEPTKNDLELY